jgi:hypothetical protein
MEKDTAGQANMFPILAKPYEAGSIEEEETQTSANTAIAVGAAAVAAAAVAAAILVGGKGELEKSLM